MIATETQKWMTIQDRSQEFRWLERDGKLVLQVACPFQHQHASGFEWRDIPVVKESK
jgi:hypothetical protein